jgi:polysaccharide export outer membrane protein
LKTAQASTPARKSLHCPCGNQLEGLALNILKGIAFSCLVAGVSGCGVSYNSPSIKDRTGEMPVSVVEMNAQTVASANSTAYTPKSLPAVFYAAASNASSTPGAGALPAQPFLPSENREELEFRPLPETPPTPYRIGVGDVLLLATKSPSSTVEQLSGLLASQNQRQGYTVRDGGTIAIPNIEAISVAGLTLQEAEDVVFQALVRNQLDPTFSLEVAEFNSQRVAIGGAVKSETLVPITLNRLTLSDALTAAGGLTLRDEDFASIRIFREGTLYQIPVKMFRARADLQNRILQNGDAVFVDTSYDLDRALTYYKAQLDVIALRSSTRSSALQALSTEIGIRRSALDEQRRIFELRQKLGSEDRDFVYLTGEVNDQSRVPLPYDRQSNLADVLYGQGGFDTTTGDPSEIYVLRETDSVSGAVTAYHLDARNAADVVLATKFEMRPNDVVFVEEQPITKWSRALQQAFPSLLRAAERSAM